MSSHSKSKKTAGQQPKNTPAPQAKSAQNPNAAAKQPTGAVKSAATQRDGAPRQSTSKGLAGQRFQRQMRQQQVQRQQNIVTGGLIAAVLLIALLIAGQNNLLHWPFGSSPKIASATSTASSGTPAASATGGSGACTTADFSKLPAVATTVANSAKLTDLGQGLKYVDLVAGSGAAVKANDTITVNYTLYDTTGKKLQSNLDNGGSSFQANLNGGVIQGWSLGLVGLKTCGIRRLIIPPALAYGATGSQPLIQPNETLVFDVQLISIP